MVTREEGTIRLMAEVILLKSLDSLGLFHLPNTTDVPGV